MIQVVKFINPVNLKNGDILLMSPIMDSQGQLIAGDFLAEIKKVDENKYKAVPIGRG